MTFIDSIQQEQPTAPVGVVARSGHLENVDAYQHIFKQLGCAHVPFGPQDEQSFKSGVKSMFQNFVPNSSIDGEDPFFIVDLSHVVRQVLRWRRNLPNVDIRYAVKCNPNPKLLQVLEYLNVGFDCASREEIKSVVEMSGVAHVDPTTGKFDPSNRIIFANPAKQISHMKYARDVGVKYTTLDSEQELLKLKRYWPDAKCVIRIATDDSNSLCQFSTKFGASLERAKKIIEAAREYDMNLVGVSFHVGSGCQDSESFVKAIQSARKVFDMAAESGFQMNLLDLGGGFPGFREGAKTSAMKNTAPFEETCVHIRKALKDYFPEGVEFIAEPGRYIATGSHHLAVNVFAKKEFQQVVCNDAEEEESGSEVNVVDQFHYYINDGIYGSFNCIFFDHYTTKINILRDDVGKVKYPSTIFGPTCDSVDVLCKHHLLPELYEGDWLFFTNFGSYTVSSASAGFNGFKTDNYVYVWRN